MNRKWTPYDGRIDPLFLKLLEGLFTSHETPTPEETKKLHAIKQRYDKGELSEDKKEGK